MTYGIGERITAVWQDYEFNGKFTFDMDALKQLANCYLKRIGAEKNTSLADIWFKKYVKQIIKSDNQGFDAISAISYAYQSGDGVERDSTEAQRFFVKSFATRSKRAALGDLDAIVKIGNMYRHGQGVAKNYDMAVKWYQRGVEKGDREAQYNLGEMYAYGFGVAKDQQQAINWYKQSAEQDHQGAMYSLKTLGVSY